MKMGQLFQVLCLGLLLEAFLQGKELIDGFSIHLAGIRVCASLAQVHISLCSTSARVLAFNSTNPCSVQFQSTKL